MLKAINRPLIVYCFKLPRSKMSWFFCQPDFPKSSHKVARLLHITDHNGATQNSLKITEMSLMILSCMHVLCRQAHLVKKALSRYNDPHILRMGSKSLQREWQATMWHWNISRGKIQEYSLKSDSILLNFSLQITLLGFRPYSIGIIRYI